MFRAIATTSTAIQQTIEAIEASLCIVQSTLDTERAALQSDRFGRCASEMPPSLRHLYETGTWANHEVYLWPQVLALSVTGHHLADAADAALDRYRYYPPTPTPTTLSPTLFYTSPSSSSSSLSSPDLQQAHSSLSLQYTNPCSTQPLSITETAIREAKSATSAISAQVREVLLARRKERHGKRRDSAKEYKHFRRIWMDHLKSAEQNRPQEVADRMKKRDRELLVATRAPSRMGASMTFREIDLTFEEIEAAGGTAGGLERWGRSITTIPDHNPFLLPAACDGGGVLIENPLAYHYACKNINPWTTVERLMFLEKFLVHGKNFRKIAQYFEHKSCEDVVRFYFDNKKQLKLKQLVKDQSLRKKNAKKNTLTMLSRLPKESRNIRDNFIFQPGFGLDDDDDDDDDITRLDWPKVDPFHGDPVARLWSPADCSALIFALCRFDVDAFESYHNNVHMKAANSTKKRRLVSADSISTVWSSVAAMVKSKTPRQCREFYMQYKKALGLDGYRPPKRIINSYYKRPADDAVDTIVPIKRDSGFNNNMPQRTQLGKRSASHMASRGRVPLPMHPRRRDFQPNYYDGMVCRQGMDGD